MTTVSNKRRQVRALSHSLGLYIADYSPGDGKTRYKVFNKQTDYFGGCGEFKCVGIHDLLMFLIGVAHGVEREKEMRAERCPIGIDS